jgi:hypothetical protein
LTSIFLSSPRTAIRSQDVRKPDVAFMRKVTKVAVPIIVLLAISGLFVAEAGPVGAAFVWVGMNVAGGTMIIAGALCPPLVVIGATLITAALIAATVALGTPTP